MSEEFVPPLISSFRVSPEVIEVLKSRNIETFFPIQAQSYDAIYDKQDVIGRARTGQGKTIAFALPLCERLFQTGKFKGKAGRAPQALVLLPTRELCLQVFEEIEKVTCDRWTNLAVYGGADMYPQVNALRRGVDIVVGTPGRVIDLVTKNRSLQLNKLRAFVLDEADQMLENDFKDNVEELLRELRTQKRDEEDEDGGNYSDDGPVKGLQFLMFSATLPPWVAGLARQYMSPDHVKIDVAKDEKQHAAPTVRHLAMQVANSMREKALADVLTMYAGLHGRAIVFCSTKQQCNNIALNSNIKESCQALHGDIPQAQREQTMKAFKEGKFRCLVATDVAARGLHVDGIELVVQMFPPDSAETYIHRSGRTGRANKKGVCLTFCQKNDMRYMESIEHHGKFKFERVGVPQPDQLLESTSDTIVEGLQEIDAKLFEPFRDAADRFLASVNGDYKTALAMALCELCGYSDPSKNVPRSALTGREGFKAFHLTLAEGREARSPSYIWSVLRNLNIPQSFNIDDIVSSMQLTDDRQGAVFDVSPEGLEVFNEAVSAIEDRTRETYFDIQPCTGELPKLYDHKATSYGGNSLEERALAKGKNPNSNAFRARFGDRNGGGRGGFGGGRGGDRGGDRDGGYKRGREGGSFGGYDRSQQPRHY